jgi:hypothetical protein
MRVRAFVLIGSMFGTLALSGTPQPGGVATAGKMVTGTLTVDGNSVPLEHAYLDLTDAEEPIVVLSDQPLPANAIPFLSEKLVKDKKVHAIAFSISRKTRTLSNTFGKVYCPGHELGVGWGRVEDGNVRLTIQRLEAAAVEGSIATTKTVKLSDISYSFELTFKAKSGGAKP